MKAIKQVMRQDRESYRVPRRVQDVIHIQRIWSCLLYTSEHGVVINALNDMRNDLIGEERPTDIVDEVLLKAIDAPTRKVRGKSREER